MLDETLGLTPSQGSEDFYPVRLYNARTIYLNKSNTKWILIGVLPGADFTRVAYICGKDAAVRIPDIMAFVEKVGELGLSAFSGATAVVEAPSSSGGGSLTIAKSDFASGTYKIFNSMDSHRCVYVANTSFNQLRAVMKPLLELYKAIDEDAVQEEFYKLVYGVTAIADSLGVSNYQLLEGEMFRTTPEGINMPLFCETIANFHNFFYRQVRKHLSPLSDIA